MQNINTVTQSTFLGIKPHDRNIECQQEKLKEINSAEVKINDITLEINKTTERTPENCRLDNQIKPSPDPPLNNQMKHSFESAAPDKVIHFYYVQQRCPSTF